jgi:uncharacterized protein (TIGR00251 family)
LKHPFLALHAEGVLISLRVTTKSSKSGPLGVIESRLKWGVNAAPVDGKANQALIEDIARRLHCAKTRISIYKGAQSKNKTVLVRDASPEQINLL